MLYEVITEFIGPDGLAVGEVDTPKAGPGQVRVAVHAATVTYMDTLIVSGLYQMKPPLPFVAGTDAAGEVIEIGEGVTHFKPGDRVATFNWTGAFAEEMVARITSYNVCYTKLLRMRSKTQGFPAHVSGPRAQRNDDERYKPASTRRCAGSGLDPLSGLAPGR